MISLFQGGFAGTVNDSPAFNGCRWAQELMNLELFEGVQPCIYADSAYAASPVLKKPGQDETENDLMVPFRIIIEQSFGKLKQLWQFINYTENLRILVQDIPILVKCAVIFTNAHTALTGTSSATATGGVPPPSLAQYLSIVRFRLPFRSG